jgi:hypothetical protein
MLEVIAEGATARFDTLLLPDQQRPATTMRHLYQAMDRNLRIAIDSVSMSSGRANSQWIAPARIGFDGGLGNKVETRSLRIEQRGSTPTSRQN